MKLGSFLIGSVAGAALAMYAGKRIKSMRSAMFSSESSGIGSSLNDVIGQTKNFVSGSGRKESSKQQSNQSSSSSHGSGGSHSLDGKEALENLIAKDSQVKAAVDEILVKNAASSQATH
ncbi:hypothetical protein ACI48J_17650 [Paenibacillus chitinolyticus]|uniref:hypothetical protein n=1 Tax=Paenibacillus chitinolyticus TaxID=79263 RepID=UPI00386A9B37